MGGAIGSLLRNATDDCMAKQMHCAFPFATFAVNAAGSFFVGLFYALSERYHWFAPKWRLFIIPVERCFAGVLVSACIRWEPQAWDSAKKPSERLMYVSRFELL